MPTYVYRCAHCGQEFEFNERNLEIVHEGFSEDGEESPCGGTLVRVYTPPNLTGLPTRGPKNENEER